MKTLLILIIAGLLLSNILLWQKFNLLYKSQGHLLQSVGCLIEVIMDRKQAL